jgi:hypothetical protein
LPALAGRRIFIVGVGGRRHERVRAAPRTPGGPRWPGGTATTPPMPERVRAAGIPVAISAEPEPSEWLGVFSSRARTTFSGRARGELLAELVSLRPRSFRLAGRTDKDDDGRDDRVLPCAARPAIRLPDRRRDSAASAGTPGRGRDGWSPRADESDRTVRAAAAEIGVVTNVELRPSHPRFRPRPRSTRCSSVARRTCHTRFAGWELEPAEIPLAPAMASTQRRNAACALAALELCEVDPADAAPVLAEFRGAGRRFELVGEPRGIAVYDDYAAPSERRVGRGDRGSARNRVRACDRRVPASPLLGETRHLSREFAVAAVRCGRVSASQRLRRPRRAGRGRERQARGWTRWPRFARVRRWGWTPSLDHAVSFVAARAEPGDVAVTVSAGDIELRSASARRGAGYEDRGGVELRRLTTMGPAAPPALSPGPRRSKELQKTPFAGQTSRNSRLCAGRARIESLAADDGFEGLVLKACRRLGEGRGG